MSTTTKPSENTSTPKPQPPIGPEHESELPAKIPAFPPPDDGDQGGSGGN